MAIHFFFTKGNKVKNEMSFEEKIDMLNQMSELGVNEIIPVKTERSIVKIDKVKEEKKKKRIYSVFNNDNNYSRIVCGNNNC